ncbi:MAG: FAD-dependent oxidoreductase [Dysosmobacter sp.]
MGYTHIFFAVGAGKAGQLDISGNVVPVIQWLRDLKAGKDVSLGHVAVVGGGNTAMDAARAALRAGAKTSTLVYRRTKKYMPADAEELELAMADGVRFLELVAPVEQANGKLKCEVMKLGDPDEKGRRSPVPTGELMEIHCDTVIAAVGEQVDSDLFTANGIDGQRQGHPRLPHESGERLCGRRRHARPRHRGGGHCRRAVFRQCRHRQRPQRRHPR